MASVHIRSIHYILHFPETRCAGEWAPLFEVSVLLLGHGLVAMLSAVLLVEITLSLAFECGHEDLIEDRMFVTEVPLRQAVCVLERVDE